MLSMPSSLALTSAVNTPQRDARLSAGTPKTEFVVASSLRTPPSVPRLPDAAVPASLRSPLSARLAKNNGQNHSPGSSAALGALSPLLPQLEGSDAPGGTASEHSQRGSESGRFSLGRLLRRPWSKPSERGAVGDVLPVAGVS
jgi:hypothetical protein